MIEFAFFVVAAYLLVLYLMRNMILDKIDRFNKNNRISVRIFLPIKFDLDDEYPDKEILKLSRKFDKLLGSFYVVFIVFILLLIVVSIIDQVM